LARGEIAVNAQHFWTFVWLRWRLRRNQVRRGGTANAVILATLAGMAIMLAFGVFAVGMGFGYYTLRDVSPTALLLTWDGLVVGFIFFWMMGLMIELQRTEVFSLEKFLHLPVTLFGVFVINYLSSLVRFSLIVFVPAMVGLSLGLVFSRGPAMLWLFPLLAAFFLMVTALTYQFQGWLAALMSNPRRRRTIIVFVTFFFVLISQTPNLINMWFQRDRTASPKAVEEPAEQVQLKKQLADKTISPEEFTRRMDEMQSRDAAARARENEAELQAIGQTAQIISAVVPLGWLPLGAMSAGEGGLFAPVLGTLGMAVIGGMSLRFAYRTTLRLYTGEFTARPTAAKEKPVAAPIQADARPGLLEKRIPGVSEHAAAVALAAFRSLLRAPEAKMLLLTPIIMVVVFGSMLFTRRSEMSSIGSSFIPYGAITMTLLSFVQLVGNQFGFDRSGFRVYVLAPASRRDILLGKNLAIAPLALGVGWIMMLAIEVLRPVRFDRFLAMAPQSISMFLIFCLMANWLSILSPLPIAAGSMRPASPRLTTILLQLAFTLLFPLVMSPVLIPLVIELVIPADSWFSYVPVCLILALVECTIVILLYRVILTSQGAMLQEREKKILEIVTSKAE
jgi:ABC-2 type transport system permease protein